MNTCAQCRFWTAIVGEPSAEWRECHRVGDYDPDGAPPADARFLMDGAMLRTRSDFGCVQFEPLPVPDTMPVFYANAGERVEPIPGHVFHAPNWNGSTTAMKIAINDQWFEIRPKAVAVEGVRAGAYHLTPGGWKHESDI